MELFGSEIGKQALWVIGVPPVRHGLEKVVRVDLNIKVSGAGWCNGYIVALAVATFIKRIGMDSGSEGNSKFLGQWTDGWSSDSDEEEVSKGLDSPSRVSKESEPVKRVDVSLLEDEGGTVPSSESPGGSGDQISDDVETSMLSNAAALADAEFHGVEEAYARYVEYAKSSREKKHYEKTDRKMAHKVETTTNCNAKFVVFLDKQSGKWRMKTIVQDHNHDLALPAFTNVMPAHCNINEGDKAHNHSMHEAGFQTSQIKEIFPYLFDGYQSLHFIKKDVYNYINDPKVVVIDRDESMKQAIREKFPNAMHRLCTWHLACNAVSNIKDNYFCASFKTFVYGLFEEEEFDQYWVDMVAAFGLEETEWIWTMYEKRVHWVNAYLCDKFCVGLRTTSRCEGIDASLKAQRPATYEYAAVKIVQLLKEVEAEVSKGNSSTFEQATADGCDILDPKIIKSKGAPWSSGNGKMGRRCRRRHGFGHGRRNCTTNKDDISDEVVRFYPVSVILGENSQPCGHKSIYENNPSLLPLSSFKKNNNSTENNDDDDDGGGGGMSCSSSDLFEFDHLIGLSAARIRFNEELPVYETTNLETNKATANALRF
ncbi:hypothetical protein Ahy_A06g028825 [Arachis hypogaea]|uniref:Uncharacterized protein n=1 Tax=Arachis hypogaea TaxID=3818 RepID=A0A445CRX5_ARAHY|nr:hypothetical protein Ahy_A06g028825 [Arachis hypogaea]